MSTGDYRVIKSPGLARITLTDIRELEEHVTATMADMQAKAILPLEQKAAPTFNAAQLAEMCGVTARTMLNKLDRAESFGGLSKGLPEGATPNERVRRKFTLAEARSWVKLLRKDRYTRQEGEQAAVIAVANFKGGVGKTTAAVNLAQGLSLRGYEVLLIDLDPQGSATSLMGFHPTAVDTEYTFLPLASGDRDTIAESIIRTYWDGIHLVAGNTELFASEYLLPARSISAMSEGKQFNFEEVLSKGLEGVKANYDFVIIDNPPALSYSTMNAFWASDGLLMPLVPEGLTLTSSSQFWTLFSEIAAHVKSKNGRDKEFAWLSILPFMTKTRAEAQLMMTWMREAYGQRMARTEVPENAMVTAVGVKMQTVYDVTRYEGGSRTFNVARAAFDGMVTEVEMLTRTNVWNEGVAK